MYSHLLQDFYSLTFLNCDGVPGVQNYEWEFVHSASGFSKTMARGNSANNFALSWVPGIQYGKTYDVRVRANVGGAWGSFNTVCTITTPAFPTTKVRAADCGITVSPLSQLIYCDGVPGVQDYEWEFVHSASGFSKTMARGNSANSFALSWVPGIQYGKTYDVRVRANVGGVWGSFNTVCTITTPAARLAQFDGEHAGVDEASEEGIKEIFVYPNPTNGLVNIGFSGVILNENIQIEMYDIYAKLVYSFKTNSLMPDEAITINEENRFAKGVYVLMVMAGEKAEFRKVVIQ